jgi:peptide/nickel transport system ATP-binding protein
MQQNDGELLKISGLSVDYMVANKMRNALDNLSLTVPTQSYSLGLVGESGSGKTTLGLSIMNLIEAPGRISGGCIEYNGEDILKMEERRLRRYRWEQVSMVFQSAMNSLSPVKKVADHLIEVLTQHEQITKSGAREQSIQLLESVGIPGERADAYSHELSGGMRQRVVIAMALALHPKLLIADEPTSALDVVVQEQIIQLVKKEALEKGLSLIFITHEITLLQKLVNNVAIMYAGEIAESGLVEDVLANPMHPYTEMLLDSLLTIDSTRASLVRSQAREIHGIPAVGCKFANRCKYVFDRCRVERPALEEKELGRLVACHKYNPQK